MKKLKIAQIIGVWESIPPTKYGGTERVVFNICQGLVKKGHEVHLFASGDSKTDAHLHSVFPHKLIDLKIPWSNYLYDLHHFTFAYEAIKKTGDFDIIHGHFSLASDLISISFAHLLKNIPSVFTLHSPLPVSEHQKDRKDLFLYCNSIHYVSISNNQRQLPLPYASTIYHGIDLISIPYKETITPESQNHMLWLGRIVPEKGLGMAIDLSHKLNKKLVVVGRIDEENPKNLDYYNDEIKSRLHSPLITTKKEVNSNERNILMANSKLFLFPIRWEEPFGLVMIESMACGTPVVAYARGSIPEVIKDGITGFIVNESPDDVRGHWVIKKTGIEGLCEAVQRIYNMPEDEYKKMRRACRSHAEENFTVERMVDQYEKVYQRVIEGKSNHLGLMIDKLSSY